MVGSKSELVCMVFVDSKTIRKADWREALLSPIWAPHVPAIVILRTAERRSCRARAHTDSPCRKPTLDVAHHSLKHCIARAAGGASQHKAIMPGVTPTNPGQNARNAPGIIEGSSVILQSGIISARLTSPTRSATSQRRATSITRSILGLGATEMNVL